jgi:hypothetical protein
VQAIETIPSVSGDEARAAFGDAGGAARRPSVAGYWIGGALLGVAVFGAIAWFVLGMMSFGDAVDDLGRVPAPGSGVVELSEGRKAIYYESPAGEDADVPALQILIAPAGGGAALPIESHSGNVSYSVSGHAGRSIAGFDVPRSGSYGVSADGAGVTPGVAELAIGKGVGGRIVWVIVGAFAIFFVCAGVGSVILAVTSTRRSRAARVDT